MPRRSVIAHFLGIPEGGPMPAQTQSFRNTNSTLPLPPGALLLAQQFQPKHRLTIQDVCPVLGLSRDGLYKRLRMGKLNLKIRNDEYGKKFILLSDLISYLFPEISDSLTAMPSGTPELPFAKEKSRPGRPPGSQNKPKVPGQGGAS